MIRIAFVIDTIESPTAGTEKQLLLLLKHLDRQKFQPVLCVLRSSQWLEQEFNLCQLFVAGTYSFKSIGGWVGVIRLSKFLRHNRISIVQTHFRDSSIAGILAARMAGIRTIVGTRRNQGYWLTPSELRIQSVLNRLTTLFIANSESTKNWAYAIEGIPRERIKVIYNGIEIEPFEKNRIEERSTIRHILKINDNTPVVGIVANLRPVKGIEVFLRAASHVLTLVPNACFLIIGEGGERGALEGLTRELGIERSVLFLGRRKDVITVLTAFDVGVLSSHSESFANSVIEYLATGIPVACTDVGGCREAMEGGGDGIIVPVNDHEALAEAIITLLKQRRAEITGPSMWVRQNCELQGVMNCLNQFYSSLVVV